MIHYAHEPLQRSLENFTIKKPRDLESQFHKTGRYDGWKFFYTIVGKHSQGQKSHVTINGKRAPNPLYVNDADGELIWLVGNFLREMCYEEAPFLPTPDDCVAICEKSCAWQAPQLRKEVMLLGGYKDRESLLPGLSDAEKSALCILPSDVEGNMHQIAFQLCSREDIQHGTYVMATRIPGRSYGGRTQLHPSDERAIWTHEQDIAEMEVHQDMPPNLWLHSEQAIRDSVGEPYRWPLINKTSDVRQKVALLSSPTVDVWNHHMRRDDNDACGAIPRHPEEWPELSDEQLWHESTLPNLDKAADLTQMKRI